MKRRTGEETKAVILKAVDSSGGQLCSKDVAEMVGLTLSTVQGWLQILTDDGKLKRDKVTRRGNCGWTYLYSRSNGAVAQRDKAYQPMKELVYDVILKLGGLVTAKEVREVVNRGSGIISKYLRQLVDERRLVRDEEMFIRPTGGGSKRYLYSVFTGEINETCVKPELRRRNCCLDPWWGEDIINAVEDNWGRWGRVCEFSG